MHGIRRDRTDAVRADFNPMSHTPRKLSRQRARSGAVRPREPVMESVCRYAKTARAWEVLARPDGIDRRAHTLLLMANGRRSLRELSRLLDADVSDLALDLLEQGYLHDTAAAPTPEVDEDATSL